MRPLFRTTGRLTVTLIGGVADVSTIYCVFHTQRQVNQMETTNTLLPILFAAAAVVITIVLVGIIVYWRLKDRMDVLREDAHEVMMMLALIGKRRTNHIMKGLIDNNLQPYPKSWLTDEEKRLHKSLLEKRQEILGESDTSNNNSQP
ncbi:MAG: hypothetical protein IT216_03015 [Saprospiraceae bacterium]|nr:hypothetical protein [Saprospiraceae bacterium]